MATYAPEVLARLSYQRYAQERETRDFFIDKKALEEAPSTGIQYLFFTAPELSLTSSRFSNRSGSTASASDLIAVNGKELKLPDYSESIYTHDMVRALSGELGTFMAFLTNRAKSIPASDRVMDVLEYAETWNKHKIPIGTTSKDSQIAPNLEIRFREDDKTQILKFFKLWMDYIEGVFAGRVISAYSTYGDLGNTQTDVFDYMSSIYTFSLRPDGKTIQHWSKYTGVFPVKLPYGSFASEDGEINFLDTVSIDFQAAYKEDMDIQILRDFNLLSNGAAYINNPSGEYYDQNMVTLPPIGNYPGIGKTTNQSTGAVTYELHISDPNDINGNTRNYD